MTADPNQPRPDVEPAAASEVLNALSFDIEDWFHLVEIDAVADTSQWDSFPSIVEHRTEEILQICRSGIYNIVPRIEPLRHRILELGNRRGTL